MAIGRGGPALSQVCALFSAGSAAGLSDSQLLERFKTQRCEVGEAAFSAIVQRHGPMVLRVCRAILHDADDAQDAFQATFLVLVRRADSIRQRDSIGPWLLGVARRVSTASRSAAARRRRHERLCVEGRARTTDNPEPSCDLPSILQEEIDRLPTVFRDAIVLCDFAGLSHSGAAERLGCPEGTIKSRHARARKRLRSRLERRGLAPGFVMPAAANSLMLASERLAPSLVRSTVESALPFLALLHGRIKPDTKAALLAERVLNAMFLAPWKIGTAIVLSLVVLIAAQTRTDLPSGAKVLPANRESAIQRGRPVRSNLVELEGRTAYDPDMLARIRSRFSDCRVEKVHVSLGQLVRKGDALINISSSELELNGMQVQIAYRSWMLWERLDLKLSELFDSGQISRTRLVDSQKQTEKLRLAYSTARESLERRGLSKSQIEQLTGESGELLGAPDRAADRTKSSDALGKLTLLAPADGVVRGRTVLSGELVDESSIMMTLVLIDPVWVWAVLPENQRERVHVGQRVEVRLPGQKESSFSKIESISSANDDPQKTSRLRFSLSNSDGLLRADVRVRIVVHADSE